MGRTGIRGRGLLGRWGPNHAADPIVTRWLRDSSGKRILNQDTKKPILEFVGIMRRIGGEWAIPGVSNSSKLDAIFVDIADMVSFFIKIRAWWTLVKIQIILQSENS